ncbi:MAG: hypothetical protein ACE5D6_03525, partial [Candidatus Zixiibacteriota bacterium]
MFKTVSITVILLATISISLAGDSPALSAEDFGLKHLTEYLGLKPDDIGYRSDYTEPDSFRLQIVSDLMTQPLGMIKYVNDLKNSHIKGQPEIIASYLFQDLAKENQTIRQKAYLADVSEIQRTYNLYYADMTFNQLLTRAAVYLDVVFPRSIDKSLAFLSKKQSAFLINEFKELLVSRVEDEFLSVEAIDSLDKIEESYCEK